MLDKVLALLREGGHKPPDHPDRKFTPREVASAALLVEAAQMDGDYGAVENDVILGLLRRKFALDDAQAAALMMIGDARQQEAADLYRFTRALSEGLAEDEKIALIEMLWEVVLADGRLDPFEDQLVRQVAGLLHVPDRARGEARQRVQTRLG